MDTILVAIGANLPDAAGRPAIETCRWAVRRLAALAPLRLRAVSCWYATAAVPASAQPDYVNGVVRLSGAIDPAALLARLHAIEAEAGRVRSVPNAARVLDLDLLAMDGVVLAGPAPVLPHPRMTGREFVLRPLCDVAPTWRHPVDGRTARALLEAVGWGGARAIASDGEGDWS